MPRSITIYTESLPPYNPERERAPFISNLRGNPEPLTRDDIKDAVDWFATYRKKRKQVER
jgi:hypothetical protein